MDRTLTNPKPLRRLPHRSIVLNNIVGNLDCTFLNIIFQKGTPQNTFLHCMKYSEGLWLHKNSYIYSSLSPSQTSHFKISDRGFSARFPDVLSLLWNPGILIRLWNGIFPFPILHDLFINWNAFSLFRRIPDCSASSLFFLTATSHTPVAKKSNIFITERTSPNNAMGYFLAPSA